MQDHPIPTVTEPFQYRAIGVVRGVYRPGQDNCFTRGSLLADDGQVIEAVVLGRVLSLIKRHLDIENPHLWVVYPRSRDAEHLHLQIAGIWEPSTLRQGNINTQELELAEGDLSSDSLKEGDDYFSVRGELIYTKPESNDLVIKIRQKPKPTGKKSLPFKLRLRGEISLDYLRYFVCLNVRRKGQELHLESYKVIGPILTRAGKKNRKGGQSTSMSKMSQK